MINIVEARIEPYFEYIPLLGYWNDIKSTYAFMGFNDAMTDSDKIVEYSYISEQMHNLVSRTKKKISEDKDNLAYIKTVIEEKIDSLPDTADERKTLVFYFMRDQWLRSLYSEVNQCIYALENNEPLDEDEEF